MTFFRTSPQRMINMDHVIDAVDDGSKIILKLSDGRSYNIEGEVRDRFALLYMSESEPHQPKRRGRPPKQKENTDG